MNVQLIAIVGGSASGKTRLARRLATALGETAARLSLDDFYRDHSHLSPAERAAVNFDHPNTIDWPLFQRCLTGIKQGKTPALPRYDFKTHTRSSRSRWWRPRPFVVLDGLWLLRRPTLRRIYDLTIFLRCPESVCFQRRLKRDLAERGRTRKSIQAQFTHQVAPMHRRFVEPQARLAEVVLDSPIPASQFNALCNRCRALGSESQP